jgi:hypothetical protein
VGRLPLNHLFSAYFALYAQADAARRSEIEQPFLTCFQALWPVIVPRLSADACLECFAALVTSLQASLTSAGSDSQLSLELASVAAAVTSTYQNSLANATNKKKVRALVS